MTNIINSIKNHKGYSIGLAVGAGLIGAGFPVFSMGLGASKFIVETNTYVVHPIAILGAAMGCAGALLASFVAWKMDKLT
jgi:hypothetical protein